MEKDIGKIKKNDETDIIIRIDDFGGQPGLTIREFVHSQNYTGFTKAGIRIKSEKLAEFKAMINSVSQSDLLPQKTQTPKKTERQEPKEIDSDESGIDEEGLM